MIPTLDYPMFYDLGNQANIQCLLSRVDPLVLTNKIADFRKLNISRMDSVEIDGAISNVLCWNGVFSCYTNIKRYPAGTRFFRVKKLKGATIPNERFCTYSDFWETNAKYLTTYGRLNKPGESLLYVSPDIYCSVGEVHIQEDEIFAAIQYTAKTDVKVNMIGGEIDYEQLDVQDEKVKLVHEIYKNFLQYEFSRDVGKGTEYLYKVSEAIAKNYFDLPPRIVQDAWAYTSVQDKTKYNVCFRPDIAHELLKLNGAMICKIKHSKEIQVFCVAIGADDSGNILFYHIGSEQQKQIFPEITLDTSM